MMVNIPMKSAAPLNRASILSLNQMKVRGAQTSNNIQNWNKKPQTPGNGFSSHNETSHNGAPRNGQMPQDRPIPALQKTVAKGQKVSLETEKKLSKACACLGWNTINPDCDVDVSAFLLASNGKVPGDAWFVFYGQDKSPDNSTIFSMSDGPDREIVSVDFNRLDPRVAKIVFVLTIHEAFEKHLNFSMLKDAYIRILDGGGRELASFIMDEYYTNVTSMMIGEIYQYNGTWKFNAIGNGVARDLAGLCGLYGVQVE